MAPTLLRKARTERFLHLGVIAASLAAWILLAAHSIRSNFFVENVDFFPLCAARLDLRSMFGQSFWPVGYPLTLRVMDLWQPDLLLAAKVFAVVLTALMLLMYWHLARQLMGALVADGGLVLCVMSPTLLRYGTSEGTDLPAAFFASLGIYLSLSRKGLLSHAMIFGAGFAWGLATVFRHQSLPLFVVFGTWQCAAAWMLRTTPETKRPLSVALVSALGFCVGMLPHALPSLMITGSVFSTSHAANFAYGFLDETARSGGIDLRHALEGKTSAVAGLGVHDLFRIWFTRVVSYLRMDFAGFPLTVLGVGGVLAGIRDSKILGWASLSIILVTAMIAMASTLQVTDRYLIMFIPAAGFFSAWLIRDSIGSLTRSQAWNRGLAVAGISIAVGIMGFTYVRPFVLFPRKAWLHEAADVHRALVDGGYRSPSEVLSFSWYFYDISNRVAAQYRTPWQVPGFVPYRSTEDILQRARRDSVHFVVYHNESDATKQVEGLTAEMLRSLGQQSDVLSPAGASYVVLRLHFDSSAGE
jgi:hypothetical protein